MSTPEEQMASILERTAAELRASVKPNPPKEGDSMWIKHIVSSDPFKITFKQGRWHDTGNSWDDADAKRFIANGCWLVVPAPAHPAPVPAKTRGEVVAQNLVVPATYDIDRHIRIGGTHVCHRFDLSAKELLDLMRHIFSTCIDSELSAVHAKYDDATGKLEKVTCAVKDFATLYDIREYGEKYGFSLPVTKEELNRHFRDLASSALSALAEARAAK